MAEEVHAGAGDAHGGQVIRQSAVASVAKGPGRRAVWVGTLMLSVVAVVLAVCAAYVSAGRGAGQAEPGVVPSGQASAAPTLRELMPSNVRIGAAVDNRLYATDERYRALLAADFNAVTAENAMKWSRLQPGPETYDWTASDQVVELGQANGQAVYGHTLVWHSSVPSWVSESWSPERLRSVLKQHVQTTVSRYRGKIWAWDVANEVLAEDGKLRASIFLRKLGPGYIADAFRWAHEADPDARLFVNDYGVEGRSRKADGLLNLVRGLRAAGVPVHGVGFQAHLRSDVAPKDPTGNLRRFAALGVSVAVTELDVRVALPVSTEKLLDQALLYQHMLRACLAVPTCESFTVWGFTDASSWITSTYPGYGAACLYDSDMRPKPARDALLHELRTRATPSPS